MDTTTTSRTAGGRTTQLADRATETGTRVAADVGTKVGADLGADLGKEIRESALLLGLALVVVGLVAVLASTALLLG